MKTYALVLAALGMTAVAPIVTGALLGPEGPRLAIALVLTMAAVHLLVPGWLAVRLVRNRRARGMDTPAPAYTAGTFLIWNGLVTVLLMWFASAPLWASLRDRHDWLPRRLASWYDAVRPSPEPEIRRQLARTITALDGMKNDVRGSWRGMGSAMTRESAVLVTAALVGQCRIANSTMGVASGIANFFAGGSKDAKEIEATSQTNHRAVTKIDALLKARGLDAGHLLETGLADKLGNDARALLDAVAPVGDEVLEAMTPDRERLDERTRAERRLRAEELGRREAARVQLVRVSAHEYRIDWSASTLNGPGVARYEDGAWRIGHVRPPEND